MSQYALTIIGTCPDFKTGMSCHEYLESIRVESSRAERQGWAAMLVYSDHKQFDPWLAANAIFSNTKTVSPLIALQPIYMHPFTAAKLICSMSFLYERPVHLNLISGGFPWDLATFCDFHSHDERYERIVEYAQIIISLLKEKQPYSFSGKYYQIDGLQLPAGLAMEAKCLPMFTISGSSAAGQAAARKLGARAIQNLRPTQVYNETDFASDLHYGTRIGIVARTTSEEAWNVATEHYPDDSAGAEVRQYNIQISDSVWVKELSKPMTLPARHPYWLGPFNNGQAGCPFLVGSVDDVAYEISIYITMGFRTFLVERPLSDEDADQITAAFNLAQRIARDRHGFEGKLGTPPRR
jgi:alkanesulfonate monooxygenase